jgi:protein gp37
VAKAGGVTAIEWTEKTLNLWTGCSKVDPACAHCYIERQTPMRVAGRQFVRGHIPLVFHLDRLEQPLRRRKPTMYFINSMSDTFHEDVPDELIARLWTMMARAEQHTFQVLTKRIERARDLVPQLAIRNGKPLPNVWLGTTIGNRRWVHRADLLRDTPAAVRFISAEPLLGPLVAERWSSWGGYSWGRRDPYTGPDLDLIGIDWLIVGGESGPKHRPIRPEWVRDLRDACIWRVGTDRPTAFFFKQWGGCTPKAGGRELDGRTWDEYPSLVELAA